jgi:hypothetical protein
MAGRASNSQSKSAPIERMLFDRRVCFNRQICLERIAEHERQHLEQIESLVGAFQPANKNPSL